MNLFYIICHYDEIGLKGKNRNLFEKRLLVNIEKQFKNNNIINFKFKKIYGRFLIELERGKNFKENDDKNNKEAEKIKNILRCTFGLANFNFCSKVELDIEEIKKHALALLKNKDFKTFRITTQRTDKNFNLKSPQINEQVGGEIVIKLNKKVKLKDPDATCYIEIVDKCAYVYINKIQAPGGLPVGISGRAVCLLSGGIDSPVAAWYMAKRGLDITFVHFHSYPHTSKDSIDKVKQLKNKLYKYTLSDKNYFISFIELQKKIYSQVPDKLRIIFYRRYMFKIAQLIAKKEKALALITGEALGQVASQTIENIKVIEDLIDIPILRPLIGFDKKEIINKARYINTYKISTLPHDDCCVVFMPKNPETKAKIKEVKDVEKNLKVEKELENIILQLD